MKIELKQIFYSLLFLGQHCCLTEASIIGNDFLKFKFPLPSTTFLLPPCPTSVPASLLPIMTKLEIMHILQAQVCGCIRTHTGLPHPKTKRETSDALKSQLNQASWNRKVLKFGSENQLNVHNYLSFLLCDSHLSARSGEKSRHYQFDCVCATHLGCRSLVLKNVRITGIWIRKNYCWQNNKFRKISSMQHVLVTIK